MCKPVQLCLCVCVAVGGGCMGLYDSSLNTCSLYQSISLSLSSSCPLGYLPWVIFPWSLSSINITVRIRYLGLGEWCVNLFRVEMDNYCMSLISQLWPATIKFSHNATTVDFCRFVMIKICWHFCRKGRLNNHLKAFEHAFCSVDFELCKNRKKLHSIIKWKCRLFNLIVSSKLYPQKTIWKTLHPYSITLEGQNEP